MPYSCKDLVHGLAYGLYALTYEDIGLVSRDQLENKIWITRARERADEIAGLLSDGPGFRDRVNAFFKSGKQYYIKRVWCSLRDYMKSPYYGHIYFRSGLLNRGIDVRTEE